MGSLLLSRSSKKYSCNVDDLQENGGRCEKLKKRKEGVKKHDETRLYALNIFNGSDVRIVGFHCCLP